MYNEPLAMYISEVKINHQILKSHLSEKELVTFIKNGISPDIRNKLVFESNPSTFQDLNNLCLQNNNVCYNDWVRDNLCNSQYAAGKHNLRPAHVSNSFPSNKVSRVNSNTPRVCYNCNKPGHVAKNCYSKSKN